MTGKVLPLAATPTSVMTPANTRSGIAPKRTETSSPSVTWAMSPSGMPTSTSGRSPDASMTTICPAVTFSFSSMLTLAIDPATGATSRVKASWRRASSSRWPLAATFACADSNAARAVSRSARDAFCPS